MWGRFPGVKHQSRSLSNADVLLLDLPRKSQETSRSRRDVLIPPHHRMCHQMSSSSRRVAAVPGVLSPESVPEVTEWPDFPWVSPVTGRAGVGG